MMTRLLTAIVLMCAVGAHAFVIPPGVGTTGSGTANTLYCLRYPAPVGPTIATITAQYTNGGSASPIGGLALYDDTGAVLASTSAALSAGASGVLKIAAAGVTGIGRGGIYRWCWCSTSTGTTWLRTGVTGTGAATQISNLINAGNVWFGTAANPCVAGVPPSTTGALTASTSDVIPRLIVEP